VPGSHRAEHRAQAPTIRDVARHAGVSSATVSRVLNDLPLVTGPTRERVLRAIEALDYRPSTAARSLTSGRTRAIGVVAPFFTSPSAVERLRGVAQRLAESGYALVLYDVATLEQRADVLAGLAHRDRVDALLVISLPLADDEWVALDQDDLPIVMIDVPDSPDAELAVDDVRGGRLATEHLLASGHRRIGFVGDAPANPFGFMSSENRRRGYLRALLGAGIEPVTELQQRGPHGRVEARAPAERLLTLPDRPTAVFAASDMQAVGVIEAARARGLRVPDDVAVIGFDDIEVAAIVGLTTVRQPLHQSGVRGAELLLARLEDREPEPGSLPPLEVIERITA
jgi:DNA-binding LacI/PurR family transcriptional regulator